MPNNMPYGPSNPDGYRNAYQTQRDFGAQPQTDPVMQQFLSMLGNNPGTFASGTIQGLVPIAQSYYANQTARHNADQQLAAQRLALEGQNYAADQNLAGTTVSSGNQLQGTQATAGAGRDVGLANADSALKAALGTSADTLKGVGLQTGAAENINRGRTDALTSLIGGFTGALGNIFGGQGGGYNALSNLLSGNGQGGQQQAQPTQFKDPYSQYTNQNRAIQNLRGIV